MVEQLELEICQFRFRNCIQKMLSSTQDSDPNIIQTPTEHHFQQTIQIGGNYGAKSKVSFPKFGEKLDQSLNLSKEETDKMVEERRDTFYELLRQGKSKREFVSNCKYVNCDEIERIYQLENTFRK